MAETCGFVLQLSIHLQSHISHRSANFAQLGEKECVQNYIDGLDNNGLQNQ